VLVIGVLTPGIGLVKNNKKEAAFLRQVNYIFTFFKKNKL